MFRIITLAVIIALGLAGCQQSDPIPPSFNAERAFGYLTSQVDFGPRVPGSKPWEECRTWYYQHFTNLGLEVDSQAFTFYDPYSKTDVPLVNVIARHRGGDPDEPAILLLAHWDTRPRTDFHSNPELIDEPIEGANDGASGVAVLMELANLLAEVPPRVNIDLLLTDGEDWGKPGDSEYYLLGAKQYAAQKGGIRTRYRYAIVVDMIGDSDQQIYREGYSQRFYPELNDMIWTTAAQLGVTTFVDSTVNEILDDHMAIAAGGVPTVNIIDFDYPYWHTEHDTVDKCSPEALKNVGDVVTFILYNRSIWPEM